MSFRRSARSKVATFELSPEQEKKVHNIYKDYQRRAEKKGIHFTIPEFVFRLILQLRCYYCKHKVDGTTVGIDRINNSEGYVSGNCVPCCWDCNRSKSNKSVHNHLAYLKRFNPNLKVKGNPLVIRWDEQGYRLEPYKALS